MTKCVPQTAWQAYGAVTFGVPRVGYCACAACTARRSGKPDPRKRPMHGLLWGKCFCCAPAMLLNPAGSRLVAAGTGGETVWPCELLVVSWILLVVSGLVLVSCWSAGGLLVVVVVVLVVV